MVAQLEVQLEPLPAIEPFRLVRTFVGPPFRQRPQGSPQAFVEALAASDDGRIIAAAYADVVLWNVENGERLGTLPNDAYGEVRALAFAPGGALLVAGHERCVVLWNVATRQVKHVLARGAPVNRVGFSADGTKVVAAYKGDVANSWQVETGAPLRVVDKFSGRDFVVALSSDAELMVTARTEGRKPEKQQFVIQSTRTGKKAQAFGSHLGQIEGLAFSVDGSALASVDFDGQVVVWSLETGEARLRVRLAPASFGLGSKTSCAFTRDGKRLVVTMGRSILMSFELEPAALHRVERSPLEQLRSLAMSADGKSVFIGSQEGRVHQLEI